MRIEDYALIGDCRTAALVSRDGSVDWLCLPRFDSSACFAALLGTREHGRFRMAPQSENSTVTRRYRDETLILETTFTTPEGEVTVIDFMATEMPTPTLVRIVVGKRGRVPMRMDLAIRFDLGSIVPWVQTKGKTLTASAGPDSLRLETEVSVRGEKNMTSVAEFEVEEGDAIPFALSWYPSHEEPPASIDTKRVLEATEALWRKWSHRCTYDGPWRADVLRSLLTLKALTDHRTGAIVAAATTSLPECIGGSRNWDYRYCWLRDATFTLLSLMTAGYELEAARWRGWLLRAVAGDPSKLQIMYGLAGERRLHEEEIPWLPGFEGSKPVRVGNAAYRQFQLDVYGEVMDVFYQSVRFDLDGGGETWGLEKQLMHFLESHWSAPDEGIWEVRGPRRNFTHSKVMAWVAIDRAIKTSALLKVEAPLDRWRALRKQIHEDICKNAYNADLGAFVQYYGANSVDASALMIPLVGFLPPDDPRVASTVAAIEKTLVRDGFAYRYVDNETVDGLPDGQGAFLPCTFWLADNYALSGREDEARALYAKLLAIRNDVGLLAEEYDPKAKRMLGNFPQAFSHVSMVNTAFNLSRRGGPAHRRPAT